MNILILFAEAIFIGIYSTAIYAILHILLPQSIIPLPLLYFYLGIYKHLIGYYTGLHDYYCNNGYACKHIPHRPQKAIDKYIILDCIIEGIIFVIICHLFMTKKINQYLNIFIIGFILHLFAEIAGIHNTFCNHRCIDA